MASASDMASCVSNGNTGAGLSPVNPFYALRYQFGMLLGVDDFETEQAYHRGKMRMHNAWLHREGVVWGLDVQLDAAHNEIKVTAGLALDGAGHELHLDATACVDITQWYNAHNKDTGFTQTVGADGSITFSAHVCIAFQACLARQVPAMTEPCQNAAAASSAYSRVSETVKLTLLPGLAVAPKRPYWRLRLLFDLYPPPAAPTAAEQNVIDARNQILALPADTQPHAYLLAFRKFAALDEIELKPATGPDGTSLLLFPTADDACVALADLKDIRLANNGGALALTGGTVDVSVRPSHVATSTIEELLCGPLFRDTPASGGKNGPVVTPGSVTVSGTTVTFTTDQALSVGSVQPVAFSASFFDAGGAYAWEDLGVEAAALSDSTKITLTLGLAARAGLFRLIARGTGLAPLIGIGPDWIPLGGSSASSDGRDFVWMKEVS